MPLEPPPRDELGNIQPHDHVGIAADDGIIRRVSEQQIVADGKTGQRRLSSMVFKTSSGPNGGMSVDLERSIIEAGIDPKGYVTTPRWMGSIRFLAGALRDEQMQVGFNPLPDNPHHGEVWGEISRSKVRQLRRICEWFVPIANTAISDE